MAVLRQLKLSAVAVGHTVGTPDSLPDAYSDALGVLDAYVS